LNYHTVTKIKIKCKSKAYNLNLEVNVEINMMKNKYYIIKLIKYKIIYNYNMANISIIF